MVTIEDISVSYVYCVQIERKKNAWIQGRTQEFEKGGGGLRNFTAFKARIFFRHPPPYRVAENRMFICYEKKARINKQLIENRAEP